MDEQELQALKQEAFNKVWEGLKSQDFKKSVGRHGQCVYRGPNGLKCAAGWLIDDADYCGWMEGENIHGPAGNHLGKYLPLRDGLIFDLQVAHDGSSILFPRVEERVRQVAAAHGLTVPA